MHDCPFENFKTGMLTFYVTYCHVFFSLLWSLAYPLWTSSHHGGSWERSLFRNWRNWTLNPRSHKTCKHKNNNSLQLSSSLSVSVICVVLSATMMFVRRSLCLSSFRRNWQSLIESFTQCLLQMIQSFEKWVRKQQFLFVDKSLVITWC